MNRNETIDALTAIAAYDRRTVGEADVAAWHAALGDLELADVLAAIPAWFGQNTGTWTMPGHIRQTVREQRRAIAEQVNAEQLRNEAAQRAATDPQIGLPIGTADGKPVWSAYEQHGAIDLPCLTCKSKPNESCTNTQTGQNRKIPCTSRLIAGAKRRRIQTETEQEGA